MWCIKEKGHNNSEYTKKWGKTMLGSFQNGLTRYENKYLNCYHSLLISYLNSLEYPVDLLFYRSLENTKDIYNHYIKKNGWKWNYPYTILSDEDLLMLQVRLIQQRSTSFRNIEQEIQTLLSSGYLIFL